MPDRASNSELWDVERQAGYIDFGTRALPSSTTGHLHPKIKAGRLPPQAPDKFTHTCFQVTPYESYVELAEQLNAHRTG